MLWLIGGLYLEMFFSLVVDCFHPYCYYFCEDNQSMFDVIIISHTHIHINNNIGMFSSNCTKIPFVL